MEMILVLLTVAAAAFGTAALSAVAGFGASWPARDPLFVIADAVDDAEPSALQAAV